MIDVAIYPNMGPCDKQKTQEMQSSYTQDTLHIWVKGGCFPMSDINPFSNVA